VKLSISFAYMAVCAATDDFNRDVINREVIARRGLVQLRNGDIEWLFPNHTAIAANHESRVTAASDVGIPR
jgi:hypothetical protein